MNHFTTSRKMLDNSSRSAADIAGDPSALTGAIARSIKELIYSISSSSGE